MFKRAIPITQLDDLRDWLIINEWEIQNTEGPYEVLRATKLKRKRPLVVYEGIDAKDHLYVADRDMGVIKAYIRNARRKIHMYEYKHKGYVLQQTSYNWHYLIFDLESGQCVLHASCTSKLTEEEAKERIEAFLKLRGEWGHHA